MKNIILIGTGEMSRIYATLINERTDAKLVAVVGNSKDSTNEFAKQFNCAAFFDGDVKSALSEHKNCDGIILSTPEWSRKDYFNILLPTNIPLMVEKPLVTSLEDLENFKIQVKGSESLISVIHSLRMSPRFAAAKDALVKNDIGELRHMSANRNPNLRSVKRVLGKFPLVYWIACHDLDLMRWFSGSEVESVYAVTKNKLTTEDDYLIAHIHFKNGIDAVEEVSWCSPPLSATASSCNFKLKGTAGVMEINDNERNISLNLDNNRITSPDTYEFYKTGNFHYGIFHQVIDQWIKSMYLKISNPLSLENAIKSIELCSMVEKSFIRKEIVYAEKV